MLVISPGDSLLHLCLPVLVVVKDALNDLESLLELDLIEQDLVPLALHDHVFAALVDMSGVGGIGHAGAVENRFGVRADIDGYIHQRGKPVCDHPHAELHQDRPLFSSVGAGCTKPRIFYLKFL